MARDRISEIPPWTSADILTSDLIETLERARDGDQLAATEIVEFIIDCLRINEPLPNYLSTYVADALHSGLQGKNINTSLNLSRRGRPTKWGYMQKRLVLHIVHQLQQQGLTTPHAIDEALNAINDYVKKLPKNKLARSQWRVFATEIPPADVVEQWYKDFTKRN